MSARDRWGMAPVVLGSVVLAGLACGGEDSTSVMDPPEGSESGSAGAESASAGAAGSGAVAAGAGGTAVGGSAGSSEGGSATTLAGSAGEGGSDAQTDPRQPWDDGVTVAGVSADTDDRFHGVAIDADGNAYAVGFLGRAIGENRRMLIAKYGPDGTPAAGFGGDAAIADGIVTVDFSPYEGVADDPGTEEDESDGSVEEANDVALQSDGSLVVVGRVEDPGVGAPDAATPSDIVVFRLNADGTRDETFGTGGLTALNPGGGDGELAWGVAVDANDRIVVFGHGTTSDPERTDRDRYAWRLAADGTVDTSFGVDGAFSFDIPQGNATLALDDNQRRGVIVPASLGGGVVLGGYTNVAGRNQVVLAKLDDDGAPDPAFSSDGIVRLAPFAQGMAEAYGAVLQSDGSLVTTGYGNVDLERAGGAELLDLVSFRITPQGNFDPSWGNAGSVVYNPGDAQDRGRALAALADDRILMAGTATVSPGNKDAMLLLLEADGSLSDNFEGGAHKAYDFGTVDEEFRGVAVGATHVAAAGYAAGDSGSDAVLVILPLGE